MNVNTVKTRDYENELPLRPPKNKPKTNPIKPNLKNAKMNVGSVKTKDYGNESRFRPPAKQTQFKPKTNPIKPNFKPGRYC